jgi:peptidoglycan/LPS O-acetylase OafA/YrhL
MPTTEQPPAIRALTGVRWFAALWVVIFHFGPSIATVIPVWVALKPIWSTGLIGVDLFFFLSGFIISYNYLHQFKRFEFSRYLHFLALRLARIYPVYLFTLLVIAVGLGASHLAHRAIFTSPIFHLKGFVENLVMVNAWHLHQPVLGWNFPAWSVSAEWFAYLFFPFAALALNRISSHIASLLGAAISIAAYIILTDHYAYHGPLIRITTEFLCGMFLFRLYAAGSSVRLWQWVTPLGLCALPVIWWLASGNSLGYLLVVDCAVLVFGLAVSNGRVAKVLGTPQLVFLGEVSYALYMVHGIFYLINQYFLPMHRYTHSGLIPRVGIVLFYAVVIFGTAVGTYLLVEKPSRNWLRARIRAPELRAGV